MSWGRSSRLFTMHSTIQSYNGSHSHQSNPNSATLLIYSDATTSSCSITMSRLHSCWGRSLNTLRDVRKENTREYELRRKAETSLNTGHPHAKIQTNFPSLSAHSRSFCTRTMSYLHQSISPSSECLIERSSKTDPALDPLIESRSSRR